MNPVILFRSEINMDGELEEACRHLPVFESRVIVPEDSLVIARYSALPCYEELVRDLAHRKSRLLNSYRQHRWVASFVDWGAQDGVLAHLTPRSWTNWAKLPEGQFVVKGRTNSRKHNWNTQMFAETREDAIRLVRLLLDDELLRDQGLVIREYVPLKRLATGLCGLPITNEWRTFWGVAPDGTPSLLTHGFYWQASHPEVGPQADFGVVGQALAREAAGLVAPHVPFFVLDVAETEDGRWIVVEVNDGQMSGLCGCPAEELYRNLAAVFVQGAVSLP